MYRGPRSKRGGRTDTPKIQRAVNFHVAYGAPRIPPPHLLLRHVGALFRDGAPLRHLSRLLSTESSPPFTSTHACTRRGMEEMRRFSTAPRLLFSHRTAFRTRTRNAFSLSHLVGFVRAKRKFNIAHTFSIGFKSGDEGGSFPHCTPTHVLRTPYTPGREARCSTPEIQNIPSCRPEFLKTTVDSEAARTGPAARSTKPNIERPRPRRAPTRQKIAEADASNTTGQMNC